MAQRQGSRLSSEFRNGGQNKAGPGGKMGLGGSVRGKSGDSRWGAEGMVRESNKTRGGSTSNYLCPTPILFFLSGTIDDADSLGIVLLLLLLFNQQFLHLQYYWEWKLGVS